MVARGDLGVEMPLEAVPGLQKQIIRAARKAGKPVVVATQMLESMIAAPIPTRAEVSDVAQAVFEGADAVMLSAESASGANPEAAVGMMDRIASSVECDPLYRQIIEGQRAESEPTVPGAIMAAVHAVTDTIEARGILCWTTTGVTALRAARERPLAPIIVATPSVQTARKMALVWGAHAVVAPDITSVDEMVDQACAIAMQEGFADIGEHIVITAGIPFGKSGGTNLLRVATVKK
jgi:pyruvate kinase